jgi:hypothetical protein
MSELFRKLMSTDTNFVADGEVLDKIFTTEELKTMNHVLSDPVEFHSYPMTDTDEIEAWKTLGPLAKSANGQGFKVVIGKPWPSPTKQLLLLTDQSHRQQHG